MRRVAELGQGWFGFNRKPEDMPEALERLDRALAAQGRSRDDVTVTVSPYFKDTSAADLERFAELGVDRVVVVVFAFGVDDLMPTLDQMATNILEPAANL
jgi:alkanesulfonate monooxygenase SsuD/methylene tetrahydromethanopterin reductase-like flavin-dependent oxidoreductase (luciferase family)